MARTPRTLPAAYYLPCHPSAVVLRSKVTLQGVGCFVLVQSLLRAANAGTAEPASRQARQQLRCLQSREAKML